MSVVNKLLKFFYLLLFMFIRENISRTKAFEIYFKYLNTLKYSTIEDKYNKSNESKEKNYQDMC